MDNDIFAQKLDCDTKLFKKTTGKLVCLTKNTAEKLLERGWGEMRSYWSQVCPINTSADKNECFYLSTPLDLCKVTDNDITSCSNVDFDPVTIKECNDKFNYGFLSNIIQPSSDRHYPIVFYAPNECNLSNNPEFHGEKCNDNWKKYSNATKNSFKPGISAKSFIIRHCLTDNYLDYSLEGCFTNPSTGKKNCGHTWEFSNTLKHKCTEQQPCIWEYYNGSKQIYN